MSRNIFLSFRFELFLPISAPAPSFSQVYSHLFLQSDIGCFQCLPLHIP